MAADIQFGIRITADNQVFVDGVRASTAEVDKLGQGLKQVAKDAEGATRSTEGMTASVFKGVLGVEALRIAVDFLTGSLKTMREEAREDAVAAVKLETVLGATGHAAQRTAAQINALTGSLSAHTLFDKDDIRDAAVQLSSFGDIAGNVFDRTLKAGANLASLFGGDLTSRTMQLAKALTEPATSLGALERSIGKFDPALREQIKRLGEMGEVASAQNLILDELDRRTGSVAEKLKFGMAAAVDDLAKAWRELLGELGKPGLISDMGAHLLSSIADQLTRVKTVIEAGDWITRLQAVIGVVSGGGLGISRLPTRPESEADRLAVMNARARAEEERLAAWQKGFDEQTQRALQHLNKVAQQQAKARADAERELARALRERFSIEMQILGLDEQVSGEIAQLEAAAAKRLLALEDENEAMRLEASLLGKTTLERELAILARQKELALMKTYDDKQRERIEQLFAEREAFLRAKDAHEQGRAALRDQLSVWSELGDQAGAFFADLALNGRSAFDHLRNSLKGFVAEIIALFAKRWVLQIGAGLSGSSALGAAASQVGQGTATGAAGNMLGNLSGSFLTGAGSLIGGSFGAGLTYTGSAGMLAGLAELGGAGSALFQLGAALPGIGTALAIAGVLYSMFAKPRGGPKDEGSFFGAFDSSGLFTGSTGSRLMAGSNQDSVARQIGMSTAESFYATLRSLGGTAGALNFGLGFSQDPRGTAPSFVHSLVQDSSGRTIYQGRNDQVGRSNEELQAEITLQSQRALLAALQASELPSTIAKIIRSLDVETASAEAIGSALALSATFQQILADGSADVQALAADMVARSSSSVAALRAQGDALVALANRFDGTTQAAQELAAAQSAYRQSLVELLASIQVMQREIAGMFAQTRERIQLAGLSREESYRFFQEAADQRYSALLAASDPAEVQRLAQEINSYFNRAFDLLSPEEQVANRERFLQNLDRLDTAVNDKLDNLAATIAEESSKPFQIVATSLEAAADRMLAAATSINEAATNIVRASQTPPAPQIVQLRIDGSQYAIVNDG